MNQYKKSMKMVETARASAGALARIPRVLWRWRVLTALLLVVCVFGAEAGLLKIPKANAAYTIANSARFISGNSDYLSKTFGTATSVQKFTLSMWIKRAALGTAAAQTLFRNSSVGPGLYFDVPGDVGGAIDTLSTSLWDGSTAWSNTTAALQRDPSVWMHLVWAVDTTQTVAANRSILYVNGRQLGFSTSIYPPQNTNLVNLSSTLFYIGQYASSRYFDGYMSDVYFVDGQQLDPTSFGQTDSNGYWRPKSYTGTYGTNGFHLAFGNGNALGTDSGSTNNWATSTNFAATDQVTDSPTNSFATFNAIKEPRQNTASFTISNGNLKTTSSTGGSNSWVGSTYGMKTGKWYAEFTINTLVLSSDDNGIGMAFQGYTNVAMADANTTVYIGGTGQVRTGAGYAAYGNTYTTNDVIGVAYDADTGKVWFSKNNVWQNSGDPVAETNPASTGFTGAQQFTVNYNAAAAGGSQIIATANFGQGGQSGLTYDSASGGTFKYTPPSGFKALSTANLPVPAIAVPAQYFNAQTYLGTGAAQSIAVGSSVSTGAAKVTYLTSGTSWTVPADFNPVNNTVEVIGGGGGGGGGGGAGGGGGGYSKSTNVFLTPSSAVTYAVGIGGTAGAAAAGTGGTGGDTYLCNAASNCASISGTAVVVGAKGGAGGVSDGTSAAAGGASASGVGTTKNSGGAGGYYTTGTHALAGAGGGGAGGPNGTGGAGGTINAAGYPQGGSGGGGGGGGGAGGNNGQSGTPGSAQAGATGGTNNASGGAGTAGSSGGGNNGGDGSASAGTSGGGGGGAGSSSYSGNETGANPAGGAGGAGQDWDSTHGSGGGAGGPGGDSSPARAGSAGGLYGGGGSGGIHDIDAAGGAGAQGLVVITYTPGNALTFQPDLVWIKDRTTTNAHGIFDSLRTTADSTFGTWTAPAGVTSVSYLVVGGGGAGGGNNGGGGGGAGDVLTGTLSVTPGTTYTAIVGAGGTGVSGATGNSGNNSVFSSITAIGGGGGGRGQGPSAVAGQNGGSGGGAGGETATQSLSGGSVTGSGHAGGNNTTAANYGAGGGGGAGAVGGNGNTTTSGSGGNGTASSISGSSITYGGGGGGGGTGSGSTAGSAGTGGGGAGKAAGSSGDGTSGTANTGGGGGGGGGGASGTQKGGDGGSGIIILSYTPSGGSATVTSITSNNGIDYPYWSSNANTAETAASTTLTSFLTNGFSLGTNSLFNTSGNNYISWMWKKSALAGIDVVNYGSTWTAPAGVTSVTYLVVGGGGGGGGNEAGGGGGAGGLLTGTYTVVPGQSYTATVGAGGPGGPAGSNGTSGSNSVFATITATGGGGGGQGQGGNAQEGIAGGSGGGAGGSQIAGSFNGGAASPAGQGNKGGAKGPAPDYGGGAGGGAGAAGGDGTGSAVGVGGVGLANPITGSTAGQLVGGTYYLAGGGGVGYGNDFGIGPSNGGNGGGGAGGGNGLNGNPATANTGGGGGGGGKLKAAGGAGGAGGSGVIVLSYTPAGGSPTIVTLTDNGGVAKTIAHSLGAVPDMIIVKRRDTTGDPAVYHTNENATPQNYYMLMDSTAVPASDSTYWNNTAPTASVFSVGTNANVNAAGGSYVAYLFKGIDGFSKFGTYTGNAAADGPFIYTGFKPRFVMIKSSTAVDAWLIYDTARNTYNVAGTELVPNTTAADATISGIDFLSNGFKLRTITTTPNAAQTYIYAAFADVPFYYSAQAAASATSSFVAAIAFLIGMAF